MKTIFILYENNGAGHQRAARLLESMLSRRDGYRIIAAAGSELFGDPTVDLINRMWLYLVRKNWIWLADLMINFVLRAWILPILEAMQLAAYHKKLDEIAPDAIVCTADGFGKVLGLYARERSIPLYIFLTELSTFADLVNPMATHLCYFPETINAIRSYRFEDAYFSATLERNSSLWDKVRYVLRVLKDHRRAGGARSIYRNIDTIHSEHNQAKCRAVGPLVPAVYYQSADKLTARSQFGIDADKPCLLVISGSIGGEYLSEVIGTLQNGCMKALTVLAMCGRDEAIRKKLEGIKERNEMIDLRPLGFVENMAELYGAADIVIARPSASVFIEALMRRAPMMVPSRATVNDLGAAELIKKHHLGEVYDDLEDIVRCINQIIERHHDYVDCISRFLAAYPTAFRDQEESIARLILDGDVNATSD